MFLPFALMMMGGGLIVYAILEECYYMITEKDDFYD